MSNIKENYDVIIVGAGPVGLTLAIDLGQRGISCIILEQNKTTSPWPKMERTNGRSMELFRRLGIADQIRSLGFPAETRMDVFLTTRLNELPMAVLKFPSVGEVREQIAKCHDGSLPLEPYQLVSQNKVEPFLKYTAEKTANITVRYGCKVTDFNDDGKSITVTAQTPDGEKELFSSAYLVACDGGTSSIRKKLKIQLEGSGNILELRQVIFYSEDLYEKLPYGKGRHYAFTDEGSSGLVVQGCRREFTLHTHLPVDTDFVPIIQNLVGYPCDIKVLKVISWRQNLLLAEKFKKGRVLLAGDAVHLVIPTGGLGMNTGLGDAINLGWKLEAVTKGWAGTELLDSYDVERRKVAEHNIKASGWAAEGIPIWQELMGPEINDKTEEGANMRHEVAKSFIVNHGRMHGMRGAEFSYTYAGSPVVSNEPNNLPEWDTNLYTPHTRPGIRIPHMWLKNGQALQDVLNDGFTLLDLDSGYDLSSFKNSFDKIGTPLEILSLKEPHIRKIYGKSLLLIRPDLHIAWRSDELPGNPEKLAKRVTGHNN